jgi:hypothetical protein
MDHFHVQGWVNEDHSQALLLDVHHEGFMTDVESVTWVILLDASGSMEASVDHIKSFLKTFLVQAERFYLDCDFTIVKFTNQVTILSQLTAAEALREIENYSTDQGSTDYAKAFLETRCWIEDNQVVSHVLFVTDAEGLEEETLKIWDQSILSVVHAYIVNPTPHAVDLVGKLCRAKQGILQVQNSQDLDLKMAEDFARRPHTYAGSVFDIEIWVGNTVLEPLADLPLNVYAEHSLQSVLGTSNVCLNSLLDEEVVFKCKFQYYDVVYSLEKPIQVRIDPS